MPKRELCSMFLFRGFERFESGPVDRLDHPADKFGESLTTTSQVREVWRGCKGYRKHGLDICAVHDMSLRRQKRKEVAEEISAALRCSRAVCD